MLQTFTMALHLNLRRKAKMQNHNSILTSYISLLATHLEVVAKFNSNTNDWLSTIITTNTFFTDAPVNNTADRFSKEKSELSQDKQFSTHQKIMIAIKEIADNSRQYLNRLTGIYGVVNVLAERVEGGEDE